MYTYNRFIAHNEVGDQPAAFGITVADFHQAMKERQQRWAYTMNATATHDTKRGEDCRARLNVLSDLAEDWCDAVTRWRQLNSEIKGAVDDNDEYFIYQSLVASWPMPGDDDADFEPRLNEYLVKAFREAKTHSNWTEPNTSYESAVREFVTRLLQKDRPFREDFTAFLQKIIDHGIANSMVQAILKFTCPGIPDVYQGTELWDLSFVDPDNRRQVDYKKRAQWLEEFFQAQDIAELFTTLWQTLADQYLVSPAQRATGTFRRRRIYRPGSARHVSR
jgi:maltooligosyltrehalose synthase